MTMRDGEAQKKRFVSLNSTGCAAARPSFVDV
jgi:hypothetical protein